MRTYNVFKKTGEQINIIPVNAEQVKKIQKMHPDAKKVAVKSWFYRGNEVTRDDERNNGWTLVSNVDGSHYSYFAVTAELIQK